MTKQLDVEMERDIEVLNLTAPRITPEQIDELMAGVTYHTQVIPGTTTTVATAIAANGFTLAIGMTACADPANFNAEFGAKYAIRDAESKARGELWKLEGWRLKQQLHDAQNAVVLTDADALADLSGAPRPDNPSVAS
ncbi:Gp49 family protein [Aeromonas salmonicida]|uniref:Gp49 family protein n=1 Tax=Aeromonas salmonicida TaxID=645 RepID=UPI00259E92FA|nr:Gp49 family protein [Aeromonas salmonicida]MDM5100327.1 Gp49 family protein [Aeromonas salmonicida]